MGGATTGEWISLTSPADGFSFDAWRVRPDDARRGGLVLIQEIFGVTEHIRELCASYAADGYEVIAPSLYDRLERRLQASYAPEDIAHARALSEAAPWDLVAADLDACIAALQPPVFAVGYCWGGTAAYLAACRCQGLSAASCFYGRRIPELMAKTPACPTILHFGRHDPSIPMTVVEAISAAQPELPIHVYEAGHGFVSDRRPEHKADAADLARLRTLQLFHRAGAGGGRGGEI